MTRFGTRHPELGDDERTQYRREALADARAEHAAHEAGFASAIAYEAALDDMAAEAAVLRALEDDERHADDDADRYAALYDQDADTTTFGAAS